MVLLAIKAKDVAVDAQLVGEASLALNQSRNCRHGLEHLPQLLLAGNEHQRLSGLLAHLRIALPQRREYHPSEGP